MYKGRSFDAPEMRNYDKSKVGGVGDVRVLTKLSYNLILKNIFLCSRSESKLYVNK